MGNLRNLVARAVLALVDDARKLQSAQVDMLDGESRADVERFQQYGFTSVPEPGAEAVMIAIGGSRSHMVAIAVDDRRYRKRNLKEGEVCLYTKFGDYVLLKDDGTIEVKASNKVLVDAEDVFCTGNLHVRGNIICDEMVSDANGTMQEMRDRYNGHTHGATPPPSPGMD